MSIKKLVAQREKNAVKIVKLKAELAEAVALEKNFKAQIRDAIAQEKEAAKAKKDASKAAK
ncbi:MAG TPA: hypothetical protein PLI62_00460 [Spirochaetota bacterium]|nr:hypothetical protein [Spirochaetota bacterium]